MIILYRCIVFLVINLSESYKQFTTICSHLFVDYILRRSIIFTVVTTTKLKTNTAAKKSMILIKISK